MSKEKKQQNKPSVSQETWETKGIQKVGTVLKLVGKWIYQLRSVLLAIPVVAIALRFAIQNMGRLPQQVGIHLLENGQYQLLVSRGVAVLGPLAVTAVCVLLMFCSRKVLYPWLISLFTLVLPWLIWITNMFNV